jgi:hypothetical protein
MAFIKTLASMFPTLGSPNFAGPPATTLAGGGTSATPQAIGVTTVAGTPLSTTFTPFSGPGTITRGWVRVKSTSINAATTVVVFNIKATDGTTTVFLANVANLLALGAAANQAVDVLVPFMSDLNLTSLIVTITTTTNVGTFDIECALNT